MPDPIDQPAPAPAAAAPVAAKPEPPKLPPGLRCVYLRSAGDDIALFEAANASAKDAGDPGVVRTQLAIEGVATKVDPDTQRATVVAVVNGALVEYPDRQNDPDGAHLGTWRKA